MWVDWIFGAQIFSDIVFAEKNYQDGNFSKDGFHYYLRLRAQMLELLPAPHVVLYLDVSPEECHTRIHRLRKRDCEDGIPLEYLAGLDACYGNFLRAMSTMGSRVVSMPWSGFGDTGVVASAVHELPCGSIAEWAADVKRISHLIDSPEVIASAMRLPDCLEEASGGDVEGMTNMTTCVFFLPLISITAAVCLRAVADPVLVSQSEAKEVASFK